METTFWNHYFADIEEVKRNISHSIRRDTSISDLRKIKRKLIAEKPYISEIRSKLDTITANIESYQQHDNINWAKEAVLDIENQTIKFTAAINGNIIQHNIDTAVLASINIFRKQVQKVYKIINENLDKFEEIILNIDPNLNLIQKFDAIVNQKSNIIESACKTTQVRISEKFHLAKNNNQIRKISRKIKNFINEEIQNVIGIHLTCLSKFKLLCKSVNKPHHIKKCVTSKNVHQTENEYLPKIEKRTLIFIIVTNEFSLNVNWKYRKKRQSEIIFERKKLRQNRAKNGHRINSSTK